MTKYNPYLIENKAQIEEVREIENKELITPEEQAKIVDKLVKNEIPSYEEFMKTYQEDEGVSDNYYYEIDSYGDIRVEKGYGPVSMETIEYENWREEKDEEEERWYPKYCKVSDCNSRIREWETYCCLHEDNPSYVTEEQKRDRWISWGIKTAAGAGISWALGPVGSVVAGGAGWLGGKAGEAVSDSKGAKEFWSSFSSFGGDIAKGELAGELWGIGGSEIAKEIGVSATKGFKAGEFSYSVYSTSEEAIVHQNHLDRGESYKSSCKICNP